MASAIAKDAFARKMQTALTEEALKQQAENLKEFGDEVARIDPRVLLLKADAGELRDRTLSTKDTHLLPFLMHVCPAYPMNPRTVSSAITDVATGNSLKVPYYTGLLRHGMIGSVAAFITLVHEAPFEILHIETNFAVEKAKALKIDWMLPFLSVFSAERSTCVPPNVTVGSLIGELCGDDARRSRIADIYLPLLRACISRRPVPL